MFRFCKEQASKKTKGNTRRFRGDGMKQEDRTMAVLQTFFLFGVVSHGRDNFKFDVCPWCATIFYIYRHSRI